MTLDWRALTVTEEDISTTPCDCCGSKTNWISGDVESTEGWLEFYHVVWTDGHPERGATFRLFLGDWSEDAETEARWIFGATYNMEQNSFMIMDLAENPTKTRAIHLNRDQVAGTEFAKDSFAIIDAIFLKDSRLEEIHP